MKLKIKVTDKPKAKKNFKPTGKDFRVIKENIRIYWNIKVLNDEDFSGEK